MISYKDFVITAANQTIMFYNVETEDIIKTPLIGHKGNITSLKIIIDILYSTSDSNEIFAWNIEDDKGFLVDK